uniref:Uncharacterized protein n=1 Tax=Oryza meridionalis TaxID=40149 RepID=A0A0E0DG07_9ORYZ
MSSAAPPPPRSPAATPDLTALAAQTRVVRAPPRPRRPRRAHLGATPPEWAERRLAVSVDYDRGRREARPEMEGVGAAGRLRVEGSRWQRDWKVSEAVALVLALPRSEAGAVDAVLNCWAGRFARRNFPLLIRVRASSHAL